MHYSLELSMFLKEANCSSLSGVMTAYYATCFIVWNSDLETLYGFVSAT